MLPRNFEPQSHAAQNCTANNDLPLWPLRLAEAVREFVQNLNASPIIDNSRIAISRDFLLPIASEIMKNDHYDRKIFD
jgi:hypothetical protein